MSWWHDPPTYSHMDSEVCPCEMCEEDRQEGNDEDEPDDDDEDNKETP